jgi:nitroreductase
MPKLNLSADAVLATTRAVRKRLDFERPVEFEVLRACLDLAVQSPTGSMGQFWQFVLVEDLGRRAVLGALYKRG